MFVLKCSAAAGAKAEEMQGCYNEQKRISGADSAAEVSTKESGFKLNAIAGLISGLGCNHKNGGSKAEFATLPGCLLLWSFVFSSFTTKAQQLNSILNYSYVPASVKSTRAPVIFILHGYGSNEKDFLDVAQTLDGRLAKFTLQAPNAMHAESFCWYKLNFLENGDFTYDYKEVVQSRTKILSFISEACRNYKLDSTQVYIMGFSQGAIMSYELALFAPAKLKAILPLSGRLMKESRNHNSSTAALARVNVFVAHGTDDVRIKISESENAVAYLKQKGMHPVFKKYPVGHTLSTGMVSDMSAFLSESLKH